MARLTGDPVHGPRDPFEGGAVDGGFRSSSTACPSDQEAQRLRRSTLPGWKGSDCIERLGAWPTGSPSVVKTLTSSVFAQIEALLAVTIRPCLSIGPSVLQRAGGLSLWWREFGRKFAASEAEFAGCVSGGRAPPACCGHRIRARSAASARDSVLRRARAALRAVHPNGEPQGAEPPLDLIRSRAPGTTAPSSSGMTVRSSPMAICGPSPGAWRTRCGRSACSRATGSPCRWRRARGRRAGARLRRAGAIFLPLNTAYTAAELDYFLGDAEPALLRLRSRQAGALDAARGAHAACGMVETLDADGEGTLADLAAVRRRAPSRTRRAGRTTLPRSSTPRAPPAAPRARC